MVLVVFKKKKKTPASTGDLRDLGSILGSGRSPEGGQGNPLQHSFLENPLDRGGWWATVHRVTESWTHLRDLACVTHMWNLKDYTNEFTYETETDVQIQRTHL